MNIETVCEGIIKTLRTNPVSGTFIKFDFVALKDIYRQIENPTVLIVSDDVLDDLFLESIHNADLHNRIQENHDPERVMMGFILSINMGRIPLRLYVTNTIPKGYAVITNELGTTCIAHRSRLEKV